MTNILLVGFMGTGKSAVGHQLSERLQLSFRDTDAAIVGLAGKTISDIFAQDGEAAFRTWETRILESFVAERVSGSIISTGGGIVLAEQNWALMRRLGWVVCLAAEPETILKRVGTAKDRPLLAGTQQEVDARIRALLTQRREAYGRADWTCNTDALNIREVAEAIAEQFKKTGKKGMDEQHVENI